jgi:hypothetical protein
MTWGGLAVVVAILATSYAVTTKKCPGYFGDPEFEACEKRQDTIFWYSVGGAAAVGLGVIIPGFFIAPRRSDILEMMNKHNQLDPSYPMELEVGYDPSRRFASSQLTFRF